MAEKQSFLDLVSISGTMPVVPTPNLDRVTAVSTINALFSAGYSAVILTGPEGSGKSQVLRQFVEENRSSSLNFFTDGSAHPAFNFNLFVTELVSQLRFLLGKEIDSPLVPTAEECLESIPLCARKFRLNKNSPLYIVIDGLFDLCPEYEATVQSIHGLLPASLTPIKFLFSAAESKVENALGYRKTGYVQAIPPLTKQDVDFFLNDISLEEPYEEEIRSAMQSGISMAHAIHGLIAAGIEPSNLSELRGEEINRVFDLEYERLVRTCLSIQKISPYIAFSSGKLTIENLSISADVEIDNALEAISNCNYFAIRKRDGEDYAEINSPLFKKFLQKKFIDQKASVAHSIIDSLSRQQGSKGALLDIMIENQKWDDVLRLIDYEYMAGELSNSRSILSASELMEAVQQACRTAGNTSASIRWALTSSLLLELVESARHVKTVTMLVALQGSRKAWRYAQSIFSAEDRIVAFSHILKFKKEEGEDVSKDELNELQSCYDALPDALPEELGLEIASALIYVDRTLATSLLSRIKRPNGGDAFDWLIKKCLVQSIEQGQDPFKNEIINDLLDSEGSESKTGDFLRALLGFSGSVAGLREHLNKLDSDEDRIFLFRGFVKSTKSVKDKVLASNDAVDLCISASEYQPNAKVYADFSSVLASCEPDKEAKELHRKISFQREYVDRIGPTSEAFQVKIDLAIFEARCTLDDSVAPIYSVLDSLLGSVTEPDIGLDVIVRLIVGARQYSDSDTGDWRALLQLAEEARVGFEAQITKSLAYQAETLRPTVVERLSQEDSGLVNLLESMNTESARADAIRQGFRAVSAEFPEQFARASFLEFCIELIEGLVHQEARSVCSASLLRNALGAVDSIARTGRSLDVAVASKLFELSGMVANQSQKLASCAYLIKILDAGGDELSAMSERALNTYREAFGSVSQLYGKSEAIAISAEVYPSALKNSGLYQGLENEIGNILNRQVVENIVPYLCNIVSRLYRWGPYARPGSDDALISFYESLLVNIESRVQRAVSWNFLAAQAQFINPERAKWIVTEKILPEFLEFATGSFESVYARTVLLSETGGVIWNANQSAFNRNLVPCAERSSDAVLSKVIGFILKGDVRGDPEPEIFFKELDFSLVLEVLELIDQMKGEDAIFSAIYDLAKANKDRRWLQKLQNKQRQEVVSRLKDKVRRDLPSDHGIYHEGYKIVCELLIDIVFEREAPKAGLVRDRCKSVPNQSDKAFILACCLALYPTKKAKERKNLRDFVLEEIDAIPSSVERLARCEFLIRETGTFCRNTISQKLEEWLSSGISNDDMPVHGKRTKSLVDTLYRVDPEWAGSIASGIERRNSRSEFSAFVRSRGSFENAKTLIAQGSQSSVTDEQIHALCDVYWEGLGRITKGESAMVQKRNLSADLFAVKGRKLSDVFPVIAGSLVFLLRSTQDDLAPARAADVLSAVNDSYRLLLLVAGYGTGDSSLSQFAADDAEITEKFFSGKDLNEPTDFILEWIKQQACSKIIVVDPYLDLELIEVCRAAQIASDDVQISIICAPDFVKKFIYGDLGEERFSSVWRRRYGSDPIPDIMAVAPYFEGTDHCAVHDRWVIAENAALKLGSSLNGLANRESSITIQKGVEADAAREIMTQYLTMGVPEKAGKRVKYLALPID